MPPFLIILLTLAAVGVVLRGSATVVLGLLLTAALVVPGSLGVPFTNIPYLSVQHVLVLAGIGRLVLGRIDGSLPRSALRPTRVHVALVGLVLVSLLVGVGLVDSGDPVQGALARLFDLLDQLGVLVVFLALLRQQRDLRPAVRAAGVAVGIACVVAVLEYLTKHSLGEFLFRQLPSQRPTPAATPLNGRDGEVRVRVGAEFALQFAWLVVMLLPVLAVAALGARRRQALWAAGAVGLGLLAVYWSFTRTALAASVAVLVLAALLSGRRVLALLGTALVVLGGLAYLAVPAVSRHLDVAADAGSVDARTLRLAPILEVVSHHPVRGLGLGELKASGYRVTDNAYLLQYVELGVIGVVLLVLLLLVAGAETVRALRLVPTADRAVVAACVAGVTAYALSAATYDAFTLIQGTHLLWFLVALPIVLAERHAPPAAPRELPRLAVLAAGAAVGGLLVGGLVYAVAPTHVAQRFTMTTLPLAVDSRPDDDFVDGERAIDTACFGMRSLALARVDLDCTDPKGPAGLAAVRVSAPTRRQVDQAVETYTTLLRSSLRLRSAQLFPAADPAGGRMTWARTAPVWLPLAAVCLVLAFGGRRRPDRRPVLRRSPAAAR